MKSVLVDGMMSFGKLEENGLHTADFQTYEEAPIEPFSGRCKVQTMRGGNVYITECPKRTKNKPMFRQDHSSFSLGRNGRYYFLFWMTEGELANLPGTLVREANEAAAKVSGLFYKGKKGLALALLQSVATKRKG
ncbi:MAG: hypothetical protein IKO86_10210 [Prevotella sp.]|nr:hypothetical protein [Prevotella sp.]